MYSKLIKIKDNRTILIKAREMSDILIRMQPNLEFYELLNLIPSTP